MGNYIFNWNDDETASSSRFCDDCQIFGIYSTKIGVVGILANPDGVIAPFLAKWLAIDMPELGVADSFESGHILKRIRKTIIR